MGRPATLHLPRLLCSSIAISPEKGQKKLNYWNWVRGAETKFEASGQFFSAHPSKREGDNLILALSAQPCNGNERALQNERKEGKGALINHEWSH